MVEGVIHCFPNATLPASQVLQILAADNPRHVVIVAQGDDMEWHASWTGMTLADLSFAIAVLQSEFYERLAGRS